jgi:hypothetical protein
MCGRYEAGQKQKIADAFHVSLMLDEIYFGQGIECAPGSVQPVIYMKDGERQIGEMRWGFKLPDRLLFNARSDAVAASPFWKERLHNPRVHSLNGRRRHRNHVPSIGCQPKVGMYSAWLACGDRGRIRRRGCGKTRSQSSQPTQTRRWARYTTDSLLFLSRVSMRNG